MIEIFIRQTSCMKKSGIFTEIRFGLDLLIHLRNGSGRVVRRGKQAKISRLPLIGIRFLRRHNNDYGWRGYTAQQGSHEAFKQSQYNRKGLLCLK